MKKPVALLAAAMMATVPLALSANQASATHVIWHAAAGGFVGGLAGAIVGNAITQPRQPNVVVVPQQQPQVIYTQPAPVVVQGGFSQAHYNWCYGKFRSYHAPSNTYQPYNGPRQPCYSPYM